MSSSKTKNQTADLTPIEKRSIESKEASNNQNNDVEKASAHDVPRQPSSYPPGLDPDDFPDGGLEAWLVVFGGFLILFCSFGLVNCAGVFVEYYASGPLKDHSTSSITWITSLQTFLVTGSNLVMGRIFDAHGPSWTLPVGTVVYALGLMLLSLSTQYWQIILSQGVICGVGGAAVFNSASNSTLTWFHRRRAAALGIVVAGSSLGGVVLPVLMSRLIPRIGFPWTARVLGFMVLVLCGVGSCTVKSRLTPRGAKPFEMVALVRPFGELRFALTVAGSFFIFWGLYLPFNYLNIEARREGVSPVLVPYLLPIINAFSIPGRIIPGILADRMGRFNMSILITGLSAAITLAVWVPGHSTGTTIAYGALYGFTSGAWISLIPAVTAQISDLREIGARSGVLLFIGGLGALTGSPIGGAIVDAQRGEYLGLKLWTGLTIAVGVGFLVFARAAQVGFRVAKV